ncbi:MAG: carbon-nitrogen hydrolase family protein [Armatimonadota bacterium]|nr:carbon-nitrogen hydrolase family protein [bacterium]
MADVSRIKVAAYQMPVTSDQRSNFSKIKNGIKQAADGGAAIIALPECALSGYPPLHHKSISDINIDLIADLNQQICDCAKENGMWVVLGTILTSPNGLTNSALVISSTGEVAGRYDKLHLMPGDKDFFTPGSNARTFNINGIDFGALICYDVRFPEPFKYLRDQGAKFTIVSLNACGSDTWKAPVMEGAIRTRAAENSCFIIAANAAGPLQMCTSRICNPLGLDLASANYDREEMLFAELNICETDQGIYFDKRKF